VSSLNYELIVKLNREKELENFWHSISNIFSPGKDSTGDLFAISNYTLV